MKTHNKVTSDYNNQVERINFTQTTTPRTKLLMMIQNNNKEYSNYTLSPISNRKANTSQNDDIEPLTIKLGLIDDDDDLERINP